MREMGEEKHFYSYIKNKYILDLLCSLYVLFHLVNVSVSQ